MTDEDILKVFSQTLSELLDRDGIVLGMDTRRADVSGWDSLMYLNFIVAIELELGIRFRVADVESFETVGEIVAGAQKLLGAVKPKLG